MPEKARPARVRLVTTELCSDLADGPQLNRAHVVAPIFADLISRKDREHFAALHLDARNQALSVEIVSVGSLVASLVHPREVFKAAILQNAAAIIVAHNHPSGSLAPSAEDRAIHDRLVKAGEVLGIDLLDFLIVSPSGAFYAFSEDREEVHAPMKSSVVGRFAAE